MTTSAASPLCVACGSAIAPRVAACGECGSSTVSPQRRVVTVLFADLAGYTQLCAALDPEQVHLLVRPLMNGLRRACLDLGGDVPAIEGDGFMAVFGAVRDSEDAPMRALAAAVRMQRQVEDRRRAYGPALPGLRIGVNLGEVLVAPSWETGGFSVSGDAVNVGSRLCGEAAPSEVLVACSLLPVVPTSLRWSDERSYEVRHRELPVLARRLLWQEGDLPDSRRTPSTTPLLGREPLLAALDTAAGRALLVGEPGVGKTRLAHEWATGLSTDVLRVGCPSFRADDTAVATELAKALRDDWAEDQPLVVRRRLHRLRGDEVDTLEDDPVELQLAALVAVLAARAAREPMQVVVDDVHWATSDELALLRDLVATPGISVLATARPDAVPDLDLPRLDVPPLPDDATERLVQLLLPGAGHDLSAFLAQRTGGVPLYLEQCSQLLLDERTVELTADGAVLRAPDRLRQVPTVMRLFVHGRLDLLDAEGREVLSAASVTGDVVEPDLLRHLVRRDVSDVVDRLVERDLLRWEPGQAGPRLRFRHALVRDVAYEAVLRSTRVAQHRAAADWYTVRLPHGAMAARAAHLEAALGLSEGQGAPDCTLAGDTLMALLAHAHGLVQERPAGAMEVLRRAQDVVERFSSCRLDSLDLDLVRAEALEVLGDQHEALAAARTARAAAEASGDRRGTAYALWLEACAQKVMQPDEARRLFVLAAEAYEDLGDLLGLARVQSQAAFVEEGDAPSRIPAAYARAYDAAQRAGDARMATTAAQMVAFHALLHGRPHLEEWRANVHALSRSEDEAGRARLLVAEAMVDLQALELAAAVRAGREALRLGREVGVNHVEVNATWTACDAAVLLGDLDLADVLLEEARATAESRPSDHQRFDTLVSEAVLRGRQGRREEAASALERAGALAPAIGLAYVREAAACRAQVAADSGRFAEVPPLVDEVVRIDQQVDQPFLSLRPRLLRLQCLVAARQRVSFAESESLRREARERGAPAIDAIAVRWLELDDLLKGERPLIELQLPALPDLAEARAVDAALQAFLTHDWSLLLDAAAAWSDLGTTAWPALGLLWHAQLTGDESHVERARALLGAVGAPAGFEADVRAQVTGL
jgi:class 3 adenylate cyclase